jgi:hypothetical protein
VLAALVAAANRIGALYRITQKGVRNRRLTRTGRAGQRDGRTRSQIGIERIHPVPEGGGEHVNGRRDVRFGEFEKLHVQIAAEIGLIEDDCRLYAAARGKSGIAFDAAHVEITVEPAHDQQIVDVGGDGLRLVRSPRSLAYEYAAARKQLVNNRRAAVRRLDEDLVADGWQVQARVRRVTETPA